MMLCPRPGQTPLAAVLAPTGQLCQIQYSYMDVDRQAGIQGLQHAAGKGLAVVIMEPLLGGKLAGAPPAVQAIWDSAPTQRTPVQWALQWLWDQPEVSVVLSSMNEMAHVEWNIAGAAASTMTSLTPAERDLVDRAREAYRSFGTVPCTQCRYCMPCPNGVNIPDNFYVYNRGAMYGDLDNVRWVYASWEPVATAQAANCIQCRQCEDKCTQHVEISEWMPRVHQVLGEGQPYPT